MQAATSPRRGDPFPCGPACSPRQLADLPGVAEGGSHDHGVVVVLLVVPASGRVRVGHTGELSQGGARVWSSQRHTVLRHTTPAGPNPMRLPKHVRLAAGSSGCWQSPRPPLTCRCASRWPRPDPAEGQWTGERRRWGSAPDAGIRACRPTAPGLPTLPAPLPGPRLPHTPQPSQHQLPSIDRPAFPALAAPPRAQSRGRASSCASPGCGPQRGRSGRRRRPRTRTPAPAGVGHRAEAMAPAAGPPNPADHRPSGRPASSCSRH